MAAAAAAAWCLRLPSTHCRRWGSAARRAADGDFVKGSPCGERWALTETDVGKPVADLARRCRVSEACLRSANPGFFADASNFDTQILGQVLLSRSALGDRIVIGCQPVP